MRGTRYAALVLVATAAGCGQVSTATFERRGNAICVQAARHIALLMRPAGMRHSVAAAGGFVDAYAAETRLELARLRALGYPRGSRSELEAGYGQIESALRVGQKDPIHFEPASLYATYRRLASRGLTACAPATTASPRSRAPARRR